MKFHRSFSMLVTVTSLLLLINMPLNAQTDAADAHQHDHDKHASSALSLDQGKKWQTDAPLRKGMQSIRDAVMKSADAFHKNALAKKEAEKLGKHINAQVEYLIENCKLEPKADATLHVLIGDLMAGANALSKQPLSKQGLPGVVKVLQLYPDYFDHKGWEKIVH